MSKKIVWAGVVGVSLLFAQQSIKAHQQYELKISEQTRINMTAEQVRQKYMSLLPVREKWAARYPKESEISDLVTMYDEMDLDFLGKSMNTDQIYDLGREPYEQQGLGLVEACIGNQPHGMVMRFPNVRSALTAIKQIEQLPNVTFSGVQLKQSQHEMELYTSKMCLMMRGAAS